MKIHACSFKMDNFNFLKNLFQMLFVIKLVYCETDIDWSDYNWVQGSRSASLSVPKFQFISAVTPKTVSVMMEDEMSVMLNYSVPCNTSEETYTIQATSDNIRILRLVGNTTFKVTCLGAEVTDSKHHIISQNNLTDRYNINNAMRLSARGSIKIRIRGILLGMANINTKLTLSDVNLTADLKESNNNTDVIENTFTVGVLRVLRPIDNIFRIVMVFFISLVILGFGCGLDLEVVKECLKKPIAPGIGLGCQYIIMPLVSE